MKSKGTEGTSLTKVREVILFGRFLRASVVAMAVFALAFVLVPYIVAEANATEALTDVSWENISLTLDPDWVATQGGESPDLATHGNVEFGSVVPTAKDTTSSAYGTQKVAKKTIRVVTSGNYYAVYLSTNDTSSNALDIDANDSDQKIDAINDGTNEATFDSAQAFTSTGWGYAVPGTSVSGADAAFTTKDSSQKYAYEYYDNNLAGTSDDNLTKTGTGSSFYNTGKWAAVPKKNAAQQIWKANNESGFNGGSTFDVYYSIMVDTDVVSGTYKNSIVYTAMASTQNLDSASTNMSRSVEFVTSGTVETLKIDLISSNDTIETGDVKVYLVPHSTFVNNSYSVASLTESNYNQCSVSAVTSANGAATITCTMPNIGASAAGDTIAIAGDNSALANTSASVTGEYDFWVKVSKYGNQYFDYVSRYTNTGVVASVVYAGLQSKETSTRGGKGYITTMQEMEANICKNTNTWGKTLGADARVYPATETAAIAASTITDAKAIVNSDTTLETNYTIASQSAKVGTGTFLLEDSRDNKTYLVRRLADGQCWMSQNLDLNLADFAGTRNLTSENTNITSEYWDPSARMRAKNSVLETGGSVSGLTVADYQFQDYKNYGQELKWGSVCSEGTGPLSSDTSVACSSISATNNANSSWARSYNNDDASGSYPAYLDGTSNVTDPTLCAANPSTSSTAAEGYSNNNCRMPGWRDNSSMNAGTYTSTSSSSYYNNVLKDSSWQPGTITTHDGDTFTMRGSMYIGDYYNWYAATAEVGQFSTGGTVTQDICPKGWRLPVNANQDGSWVKLIATTYGLNRSGNYSSTNRTLLNKIMQLPLSIPMTGYYYWTNGALSSRGYGGRYWSSTASGGNASNLGFDYNGWFQPQYSNNKVNGLAIRCVAK